MTLGLLNYAIFWFDFEWIKHISSGKKTAIILLLKTKFYHLKLILCQKRTENCSLEMLTVTDDFLAERSFSNHLIVNVILDQLYSLYFQYSPTDFDSGKESWIRKSYTIKLSGITHLPLQTQEQFAELSSDKSLQLEFSKKDFMWILHKKKKWIGLPNSFWTTHL